MRFLLTLIESKFMKYTDLCSGYTGVFLNPFSSLLNEINKFKRESEIIDVEYEDLSDQINDQSEIESNKQLLIAQYYADTDNK